MSCPTTLAGDAQITVEPLWLNEIRLRAARRVRWLRHLWASHRYEGEQVLAISHSEVDRALLPLGELQAAEHGFYRDDARAAELSQAIDSLASAPQDPRWQQLTTTLDLTAPEAHLAALCLAAAVDPALRRVFGYLLDLQEPAGPTPGLAAQLFDHPPFWFPGPDSQLVRWHVAHPLDDGRDPYTTSTSWDADALLLPGLLTEPPAGWAGGTTGRHVQAPHPPLLRPEVCAAIVDFAGSLAGRPVEIELVGPSGSGRTVLAATAAARLGVGLVSVDARTPAGAAESAGRHRPRGSPGPLGGLRDGMAACRGPADGRPGCAAAEPADVPVHRRAAVVAFDSDSEILSAATDHAGRAGGTVVVAIE
ncbi:hypothetical protein MAUB1S_02896 [Mycolicibacterium aubagnense]